MSDTTITKSSSDAFDLATEEYEALVTRCADNDLSLEIDNFHIAHAAILTKHIIRRSQHFVDILTGSMPELFFKKIQGNLVETLAKKIPVRIIFVNKGTACSELTDLKRQHSNLGLFEIRDEYRSEVKESVCHFCVSDNKRFRIEDIHPDKDFSVDPSIKAQASFNHPEGARELHNSFAALITFSDPIKLEV